MVTAPPAVAESGGARPPPRVQGEVVAVLYAGDVARMRRLEGVWPAEFAGEEAEAEAEAAEEGGASDDSSSGLPPLAANPNRRRPTYASSSSEEET